MLAPVKITLSYRPGEYFKPFMRAPSDLRVSSPIGGQERRLLL
jgi:hypothetical protein